MLDREPVALACDLDAEAPVNLCRVIKPKRVREDAVEGRLDVGEKLRHVLAGERGIEEDEARALARTLQPAVGAVSVAVRGEGAARREPRGIELRETLREALAERECR